MSDSSDQTPTSGQRGPVHDTALRSLIEGDITGVLRAIGIPFAGSNPEILSAALPTATLEADLVFRDDAGDLVHVEYMRTGEPDLIACMLVYRGLLLKAHPAVRLRQYIIVLGYRRVKGFEDYAAHGFLLDLCIIYLRDLDPALFLGSPGIAPLAALGRGNTSTRANAFEAALRLIGEKAEERQQALLEFAATPARVTLSADIIREIALEVAMSAEGLDLFVVDSEFGRKVIDRSRREARQEMLVDLLRQQFGDAPGIEAVAERLSRLPNSAALRAVVNAESLADLTDAPPN